MGRLGQKVKKYGVIGAKGLVSVGGLVAAGYLGGKGREGVETTQSSGSPEISYGGGSRSTAPASTPAPMVSNPRDFGAFASQAMGEFSSGEFEGSFAGFRRGGMNTPLQRFKRQRKKQDARYARKKR